MADDELLGVSALAAKLGISKGTVSKQANAGKIPVAKRDAKGNPLFRLADVEQAREANLNPLMRRTEEPAPRDGDDQVEAPQPASAPKARAPSELQIAAINEKQLKGRKLFGELVEREGLTVLKAAVEIEQTTMARRTRDSVTAFMADKASAAYAFAGTPRTEAEWRVWLTEHVREAFNGFAATLALEDDDEFDDDVAVDGGAGDAAAESVP